MFGILDKILLSCLDLQEGFGLPSLRNITNEADLQSQNSHCILTAFWIVFSKLLFSVKVNGNHINWQKIAKSLFTNILIWFYYSEFRYGAYLKCSFAINFL